MQAKGSGYRNVPQPPSYAALPSIAERTARAELRRGCGALPSPPSNRHLTAEVDVGTWDSYWRSFVDVATDDEGLIKTNLRNDESEARRVTIQMNNLHQTQEGTLLAVMSTGGALESYTRAGDTVHVVFTSSAAARWLHAYVASGALAKGFGINVQRCKLSTPPTSNSTFTLQLGPSVQLGSAYADALFKSVFDAIEVNYVSGTFRIRFNSELEMRYALHVLQRSFVMVFGLCLYPHSGESRSRNVCPPLHALPSLA